MQTPEGRVKNKIKDVLKKHEAYFFMPVQTGYGASTLDFLGCHKGRYFSIEAKAPKKKPTARQDMIIDAMQKAGAKVFVIDDSVNTTAELDEWLSNVKREGE